MKSLVLDAVSSPNTRRLYSLALSRFLAWYGASGSPRLDRASVQRYRAHLEARRLAASTINVHLSAIRKLAREAADNGWLAPEHSSAIARVPGVRNQGVRAGNWLTPEEATALLNAPDGATLIGARDRAMLGLLIGCGLRRAELAALHVAHIQLRDARWAIPDLAGKGGRLRTAPVPAWAKALLDEWLLRAGLESGPVFRPLNKAGKILEGQISDDTVWNVVRAYGAKLAKPRLAPHDLRRTCAKLCRAAGGELEQIQLLLGHASVQTTERYLGTRQNLVHAVNDRLPVNPDLAATAAGGAASRRSAP